MSDPAVHLLQLHPPLGEHLADVERHLQGLAHADTPTLGEAARHVISGRGKRLRPALLLLCAEACGTLGPRSALHAAVVELMHTASLVHDDVLDEADWRRGRPSAPSRWDNKISVLLGDYLLARSFGSLAQAQDASVVAELAGAAARMCRGQVCEIAASGSDLSEEGYYQIIADKTASLFAAATRVGALGAPESLVEAVGRFGRAFGVAFQVADDILDVAGRSALSGKPVRGDLRQSKATLPAIFVLRTAPPEAQRRLRDAFADGDRADREAVCELLRRHGGTDYAWGAARRHLEEARQCLAAVPTSAAKQALLAAAGEAFPLPVMTADAG